MRFRSISAVVTFAMVLVIGVATAEATVWNAVTDFSYTSNTATDTWQYLYNTTPGINGGYTLFPNSGTTVWGIGGWTRPETGWHFIAKGAQDTTLTVHPFYNEVDTFYTSTIGWKSPISGVVDVTFSEADLWAAGGDGVGYWLFKQGSATPLASGGINDGGNSGVITVNNVSVASGDMLYLQIDPKAIR